MNDDLTNGLGILQPFAPMPPWAPFSQADAINLQRYTNGLASADDELACPAIPSQSVRARANAALVFRIMGTTISCESKGALVGRKRGILIVRQRSSAVHHVFAKGAARLGQPRWASGFVPLATITRILGANRGCRQRDVGGPAVRAGGRGGEQPA
jgi:hypothetical protein